MIKECLIGIIVVLVCSLMSVMAMKSATEQIETKIEQSGANITNSIHELQMSIWELDDTIKQQMQMVNFLTNG